MSFSTTQLTALESAIASGELEVTFDGKTVKYRDTESLIAAYNFVKQKLEAQGDLASTRVRTSFAAHAKG